MTYEETINYLYESAPLFQNIGANAYKEGLYNTYVLDEHFEHPHTKYKTIHIAGTNGKGSCAHMLAAVLQSYGYKTGLYTSPHLVDFRERIRINGKMIPKHEVIDFVEKERSFFEPLHPSFFELTTALAFYYFAKENVDIAVIEVGLGGRLDCTNIINSTLSIITNISFDHMALLGNTLEKIAYEKAGIIKNNVPVVIGETTKGTHCVFEKRALEVGAPIIFAEDEHIVESSYINPQNGNRIYETKLFKTPISGELTGEYQEKNMNTLLCAIKELNKLGLNISEKNIRDGVANVCELTGLKGRWEIISRNPTIILDTGHNPGGLAYNMHQLGNTYANRTRIVIGMVSYNDIDSSLKLMPKNAIYYFTKATVKRALNENELKEKAFAHGLHGSCFPTVKAAALAAMKEASDDDVIYIGGSNFIVGDFLNFYNEEVKSNHIFGNITKTKKAGQKKAFSGEEN